MAPHLPPNPLPLPRCGRGRGRVAPSPSSWPTSAPTRGKEGVRAALTFPPTPFRSHTGRGRGEDEQSSSDPAPASFNDAAFIHQITPLPQRGRGAGGEGSPHLPPQPLPLLHGERPGGDEQSSSDPAPASHQITPLPQRGRGAGGEGSPHLPPNPLPLPHGERQGGRGGLVRKHGGPRTQWSNMHGTSLMQHPGF